jgi:hypothetical protein
MNEVTKRIMWGGKRLPIHKLTKAQLVEFIDDNWSSFQCLQEKMYDVATIEDFGDFANDLYDYSEVYNEVGTLIKTICLELEARELPFIWTLRGEGSLACMDILLSPEYRIEIPTTDRYVDGHFTLIQIFPYLPISDSVIVEDVGTIKNVFIKVYGECLSGG